MSYMTDALEVVRADFPDLQIVTKWEVCSACQGEGSTSAHLGTFTAGDPWLQDDQFMADYRDGKFDEPCPSCKGRTTVRVIDRKRSDAEAVKQVDSYLAEAYESDAIQAAEMRACGIY